MLAHLQRMCRTRRGSVPTAPGYGLPDLSEIIVSAPELAEDVARALRYNLEHYEPRLTRVEVLHLPSDSWDQRLRFQIKGELVVGGTRERVSFETRIDPTRRISVT